MPTSEVGLDKTLVALGVTRPDEVSPRFAVVRANFDGQFQAVHDESSWKQFRDAWLGRKSGVLTQITDNWLKPATPELKRAVGAALNELRAHVESRIEARRLAIESGAEESGLARERVDLSLPGVIGPVGSRHLGRQVFQASGDICCAIGRSVLDGAEMQ